MMITNRNPEAVGLNEVNTIENLWHICSDDACMKIARIKSFTSALNQRMENVFSSIVATYLGAVSDEFPYVAIKRHAHVVLRRLPEDCLHLVATQCSTDESYCSTTHILDSMFVSRLLVNFNLELQFEHENYFIRRLSKC